MIHRVSSRSEVEALVETLRSQLDLSRYIEVVKPIVDDVRRRGDEAVFEYAYRLDGVKLDPEDLYVERRDLDQALTLLEREKPDLVRALRLLAERVRAVEEKLSSALRRESERVCIDSFLCVEQELEPLSSVACYTPGAQAPYVSTAIMCGVAARIAGVEKLVAFAPPRSITRSLLAALAIAGYDGLYRVGGAYGVAALAYGTESIERVSKIAGPGGPYYTAAKLIVSSDVGVDMLAGPTELVLYVDKPGLERILALHLAAQAEHGETSMVLAVTTSEMIAERLLASFEEVKRLYESSRGERVAKASIVVADSLDLAVELINEIAPEHVEICSDLELVAGKLRNYGVLIDGCVSSAINDYYSGANHILPTSGWARWRGGLSILDFLALRRRVFFKGSERDLSRIAEAIAPIAEEERFPLHLESIRGGFR